MSKMNDDHKPIEDRFLAFMHYTHNLMLTNFEEHLKAATESIEATQAEAIDNHFSAIKEVFVELSYSYCQRDDDTNEQPKI